MSEPELVVRERRPLSQISLGGLFRLLALACFIAAFCFAEGWLTKGTWQEWASAGLASWVLSEII